LETAVDKMTTIMDTLTQRDTKTVPLEGYDPDSDRRVDKLNALTGLDFKVKPPLIQDSDPDLTRHLREFESVLQCHAYGRRGIRPYDRLTLYKRTLQPNGIRQEIYDLEFRKAQRTGRLPEEATEVFNEIVA